MKTTTQILPGIKSIGWVDSRHLQRRVDLRSICRMSVPVITQINQIPFFGDPSCVCKSVKEGAGYQETATLKFNTDIKLPRGIRPAFVVTDVKGDSFLIGAREHALAIAECEYNCGTPSGDEAGYSYEIKHVAIKTMVPCIV